MENLLPTKKLLMVFVIALMSTFSFAISLYHQQTGNIFIAQTDDSTYVNNLRAYAQGQLNGVFDEIHLSYKGTTLNDDKLLISYSVKTNDTIMVDYEKAKQDFTMLGSNSQSFHKGMFTDSLVGNKDGSGQLFIQLKIFATNNKMDTLGKVQIIEKTPNKRLSSNVFLTILNGSEWKFDAKDGAFYAAQELTLTKSQRLALSDKNRTFELEVLSTNDKPLTTTIQGNEKTYTLYSLHDDLIGGEIKRIEKENNDGSFEMTFMFSIHATKETQNLMGAAHVHVGENVSSLQIQKGGVLISILTGTEWTYNSSEKTYTASKTLTVSKEKHDAYAKHKTYVNVHDQTGKVIATSDDDDFFGLNSRHVDIKQGLGQVMTFSLNPDSSGTFDLKVMVEGLQSIGSELGAVKLYANQEIGNFKKGDLYLVFNDGLNWTFDSEKQVHVANSTIPVTKEQFKNIFINDMKFIINVHNKADNNILLSTDGAEQSYHQLKMTDKNMKSDTSYVHSTHKMKSDGSSELMVKVMIKTNEDLSAMLGMTHFHTMFALNTIPKDGIFKAIVEGNDTWFYDGVLKAYIFEKTLMLNAQETTDYLNKENVFYVNVHDKAGKVILTSKDVDQISLSATSEYEANFTKDKSGLDITFFQKQGKTHMFFSFYAQGESDVSALLGAAHIHTKVAMENIAADGVFIPVLTGTEWKLDKDNLYRAEMIVELTDEQLKAFETHQDDRFYINVHNPQNGNVVLSSNNPSSFEYKLYSLHQGLSQGYAKGNIGMTDGKIMLNIEVTADQKNDVDMMPFLGDVAFFTSNDLGSLKKGDLFLKISDGNPTAWVYNSNKKQYVANISIPLTQGQIDSLSNNEFYLDVVEKNNNDKHLLTSREIYLDSSDLYATSNFTTQFNNGKVDLMIIPNKDGTMSIEFDFMVNAKVDASTLLGATHLHTPKAIGNIAENGIFKTLLTGTEWSYDDNSKMYVAKVHIDFTKEESAILQADGSDLYFNIHEKGTGEVMLTDKKVITKTFNASTSNTTIGTSNGTIHIITNNNAVVTVYDVLGRSLISTTIEGSSEINTNSLEGTYIVVIESATETIREKVILY